MKFRLVAKPPVDDGDVTVEDVEVQLHQCGQDLIQVRIGDCRVLGIWSDGTITRYGGCEGRDYIQTDRSSDGYMRIR